MLALTFIALAGLVSLAQASQESVVSYQISSLTDQNIALMSQNANLAATANNLQSLQRIDSAATSTFHMTKPDLSSTVWVRPLVPRVVPVPVVDTSGSQVKHASSPLAWVQNFFTFVKNSL